MSKEIEIKKDPEAIMPMDSMTLSFANECQKALRHRGVDYERNIRQLILNCKGLTAKDAREIKAELEVRDLKQSSEALLSYFGIMKMLLEHIASDLSSICVKRKEYYQQYLLRRARLIEEQKYRDKIERQTEKKREKKRAEQESAEQ